MSSQAPLWGASGVDHLCRIILTDRIVLSSKVNGYDFTIGICIVSDRGSPS